MGGLYVPVLSSAADATDPSPVPVWRGAPSPLHPAFWLVLRGTEPDSAGQSTACNQAIQQIPSVYTTYRLETQCFNLKLCPSRDQAWILKKNRVTIGYGLDWVNSWLDSDRNICDPRCILVH